MVLASFFAVGHVDIGPAIAIEVDDADRRAHRCNLRHDRTELGVKRRRLMHKIDARGMRDLFEIKAVARQRGTKIERRMRRERTLRQAPAHERRSREKPHEKNGDGDTSHWIGFHCVAWLLSASSKISGVT